MSIRGQLDRIRNLADCYEDTRSRLGSLGPVTDLENVRDEEVSLAAAADSLHDAVATVRDRLSTAERKVIAKLDKMA